MIDGSWQVHGHDVAVTRVAAPATRVLRLRGFAGDVLDAVDQALSIRLPRVPNQAAGAGRRAMMLAPGEWLIVGGEIDDAALLAATAGAVVAHVAPIGEGLVVYTIAGPRARDLIAKGCPIDLHPRAFGAGRCAQSALAQVHVLIDQPADEPAFQIYAEASYAQHLDQWFADAVLEFRSGDAD